ncbi:AAA family ATPase [bacterium]|nr:AAA family ATPase [bacterium]
MQLLFLSGLRINISTEAGLFGAHFDFQPGLNVIRAENTSGKSTAMNAILYALGCEVLVGKNGPEAMKPVLRDKVKHNGQEIPVLESYIELEIRNRSNEFITIHRQIIGEQDSKLVRVTHGQRITAAETGDRHYEFYFVGISGAAQRAKGFHHYLAAFLGLTLPSVTRFQGEDVPLYLQCIVPLLFIEQRKGWGGIQATLPRFYGIQNVANVAIEYLLALDLSEIQKRKQEIAEDKRALAIDWSTHAKHCDDLAEQIGGLINNYPRKPTTKIRDEEMPYLSMQKGGQWLHVDDWLEAIRDEHIALKERQITPVESGENEVELRTAEEWLLLEQAALSEARLCQHQEQHNIAELDKRLAFIDEEIQKNQDVLRLQNFGAQQQLEIAHGQCPTCHQEIPDTLLEQTAPPMPIENNIEFLKQQKSTTQTMAENGRRSLAVFKREYRNQNQRVTHLRSKIWDLRNDLTSGQQMNTAQVREIIQIEESIRQAETTREKIENEYGALRELSERYLDLLSQERKLPKDMFSENDKAKLDDLSVQFRKNIVDFKFRSAAPDAIDISRDNYRPTLEGFEMAFDASASDNIRLIWAYTLAMQQLREKHSTNHFGITFYDEPQQQKMRGTSSKHFYEAAGQMPADENQVIIATSEDQQTLREMLKHVEHKLFELGESVITAQKESSA